MNMQPSKDNVKCTNAIGRLITALQLHKSKGLVASDDLGVVEQILAHFRSAFAK